MVQQPFVGPTGSQAQSQPLQVNATALAMPAIISQNNQQPQYSPQANYYQQQLVKSAQQQFAQQRQPRLNGIQAGSPAMNYNQQNNQQQQQQNSPGQAQSQIEGLYNGVGQQHRPAPVYAPKPTYYTQAASQQQQQQQSLYQTRPMAQQAFYQQHHSPASLSRSVQLPQPQSQPTSNMNLQPMPMQINGMISQPANLSPAQAISDQQRQQQQQQQQQMQQLIMSYQQQHMSSMQPNNSVPQQVVQPAYSRGQPNVQEQLVQQHVDVRWSHLEEQNQLQHQQQHLISQHLLNSRAIRNSARFSDRDSISTASRFNQLDERRSMRSQYTDANAARYARSFSFVKLTGEAFKRILGLSKSHQPLLADSKQELLGQRNLILSVTGSSSNIKNSQPFHSTTSPTTNMNTSTRVTVIDSAEDYYFKRKVFKYQLVIVRLVSLLCASFVLLSPVAMLLIPKMESVFHTNGQDFSDSNAKASSDSSPTTFSQSTPSVTHAVGLNKVGKARQVPYFVPQPQWRISECSADCDGPLIGFVARLIMLCLAYWAIFFRTQTATLPRIDFFRCLLISIAFFLASTYWLFFFFRVFDKRYNDFELQYMTIVQFAISMLESLILLHYLAIIVLELRNKKKVYCLKVVRSPDGASRYYSCGPTTIQKCAQFVLEKYHRDFTNFGPYKEHLIELEDELARSFSTSRPDEHLTGERSTRSRPSSPANSQRGDTLNTRSGRRSGTTRSSRHHSRAGNRSPTRSRSRSQRDKSNPKDSQVKLYQLDSKPHQKEEEGAGFMQNENNSSENNNNVINASENTGKTNDKAESLNQKSLKAKSGDNKKKEEQENDSNSADQSSDATSRMKESSLETIRAANSSSDLLSSNQQNGQNLGANQMRKREDLAHRDETESVRSVRSRRSTKSHHRHRSEHQSERHRERSPSRANDIDLTIERSHATRLDIPLDSDPLEEHERKLRRRKFRLLVAVQDKFEQIRQIDEAIPSIQHAATDDGVPNPPQKQALGANEAARSLYPTIARSLQKYLRITKQTGRHNLQSIYEHLSKCLLYKLSARAFLEKFTNFDPVWQQNETSLFANCKPNDSAASYSRLNSDDLEINSWSLICDTLLSRQLDSGAFFVLKQGTVSLLVTVAKLPHLNLSEEVIDRKSCKFSLDHNSESSV